jgi:hypothetical protein
MGQPTAVVGVLEEELHARIYRLTGCDARPSDSCGSHHHRRYVGDHFGVIAAK